MGVGQHNDVTGLAVVFHHNAVADARGVAAARAVESDAVFLAGLDHLFRKAHRRLEPSGLHGIGNRLVRDEHKVILKGCDLLRSEHRLTAPLLLVEVHDHARGVLVHATESGTAEDLLSGSDRGNPKGIPLASPSFGGDDLLNRVHRPALALYLIGGLDVSCEQGRAVAHQPPRLSHRLKERRKL